MHANRSNDDDAPTAAAKAALRRAALDRRAALGPERRSSAAAAIRERLAGLPSIERARTVLAFAAFRHEVDLDPLLASAIDRGVGVFLPWIASRRPPTLEMSRVTDLAALVPGAMGIREPDPGRRRPGRVDRLDVVIAPGVAFDPAGGRIGYGGGYYDRLLPRLRPGTPVVAVAFDTQVVDAVPVGPDDVPVHAIVTETRTIIADGPVATR
jgi:5-formyltetrahydrofolate cyclo-ligase